MASEDADYMLLDRVLIRLYEDVANINKRIHQVHEDVAHLVGTHQLSEEDANFILSKVPIPTDPSAGSLHSGQQHQMPDESYPSPPPSSKYSPQRDHTPTYTSAQTQREARRPVPKPPVVTTFQARALWDYNLDNAHAEDLSFWHGDTIEVDQESTEKNADWWTGTVRGRTGLFPSTYVEQIVHALPPPPAPLIMKSSRPGSEVSAPTYTPYRSTHAAMNQQGSGANALGLHAPRADEHKRAKYDQMKSTMGHSAARGAGFGAGSALAGGLVRAIF